VACERSSQCQAAFASALLECTKEFSLTIARRLTKLRSFTLLDLDAHLKSQVRNFFYFFCFVDAD
jgi:hypothetical protein